MPNVMYVSLQGDDKILRFTMDAATGALTPQEAVTVPGGPAPIAVDPARRFLYVARRGERKISSYRIDQGSGALSMIGTVSLVTDPCYISTDRKGRFLLSAYYEGRGVSIHPIGDDGAVGDPPVEQLETARGAHGFQTDPANRFAFVPHIAGRGRLAAYRVDADTGVLHPLQIYPLGTRPMWVMIIKIGKG